jgi:hypothetical protein
MRQLILKLDEQAAAERTDLRDYQAADLNRAIMQLHEGTHPRSRGRHSDQEIAAILPLLNPAWQGRSRAAIKQRRARMRLNNARG